MRREPDFIIGGKDRPYIRRWWVIPRNKWFNIYLHQILRSDDDRALHDHPWVNLSFILKGGYFEVMPVWYGKDGRPYGVRRRWRGRFSFTFRGPKTAHRLELVTDSRWEGRLECWSLFLTGPNIREWGFWCPKGWRSWREFVSPGDKGGVGRGCE